MSDIPESKTVGKIKPDFGALARENVALRARIDTMQKYIDALENEPVRSMSVVKRLRTQTGMDTAPMDEERE